jgi:hypothetical protein
MRTVIPCLLVLPLLWYLTYAPIHELSHVLGAYLVGGSVTELKLIPSFWKGEFGRAWITPQGLREPWQQFVMTGAPYVLDGLSLAVGFFAVRQMRALRALACDRRLAEQQRRLECLTVGFGWPDRQLL